ncbi:MAG: sarcosine oxidase, subunit gamma [Pseudonocardiales bacterium]|nr:sarcosine oxidase, subunit gamma [Pseudonocardiales bacterium]
MAGPVRSSDGWEVGTRRATGKLTLTDVTPLAKVSVRAPEGGAVRRALGTPFGRTRRHPSLGLVVGSGPGEWLVLGPPDSGSRLRDELNRIAHDSGEFASVVELTHGRALVRLRGANSAALLAKLCAVDLSDTVTPNGAAFRSSVARITTDVVRDDDSGVRSYLLHCERSSGQYLAECLLDAGAEFDIDIDAFTSPGI